MTDNQTKAYREARAAARHAEESGRHAGDELMAHTREYAATALERAGEALRDLRYGASGLANRGLSSVSEGASVAQKKLSRYADATGRYAAEQPYRTALIAAAIGAVVAGALLAARRRRQNRLPY